MFDRKHWKYGDDITVGEFCDYLKENVPADAMFCVCGSSRIYLHMEEDKSVFSVDDCSLSDMAEYSGYDVQKIFEKNEQVLQLRKRVLQAEQERIDGKDAISVSEAKRRLREHAGEKAWISADEAKELLQILSEAEKDLTKGKTAPMQETFENIRKLLKEE